MLKFGQEGTLVWMRAITGKWSKVHEIRNYFEVIPTGLCDGLDVRKERDEIVKLDS